jgi:hypothetical protein
MSSAGGGGLSSMQIDVDFSAVLQKSPSPGGWTYVVLTPDTRS